MIENGLSARFLRGLALSPDRDAIRADGRAVTYAQLHELALGWAGELLDGPGGPPAAVGVLAAKGVEAYAGVLAALYAGAAVVPLHVEFPAARTRQMLRDARVSAVLADAHGSAVLEAAEVDLRVVEATGGRAGSLSEPPAASQADVAYILFTSGSTGRPKGVPLTHGMIDHYFGLADKHYDFDEGDVFSQTFDLNFDCAMFDMFCAWGAGATLQSVPPLAYHDLAGFAAETGLSVWFSAPSVIALVRRLGGLLPHSLPGLRVSLFAGEALRAADVADWLAAAPGSELENIYGPTELTLTITGHRWSRATSPGLCVNGLVPIGTVHDGHSHLLLGPGGETDPDEGELCVTGPQMTPGYLNPDDGAGRFLDHDGRTWYRTGDRIRRLPNGELIYLGRLDSQVQLNGMRVELGEIEHALRGCEGVEDAVAVAAHTDEGPRLAVFYTGIPSPSAELARRLRDLLPGGMLPRLYRHLPEFPLNSNRKIDRKRLAGEADELLGGVAVHG